MSSAFADWLERFLVAYYRHRPVNATFIGVHDYDDVLPDFSPRSLAEARAETDLLLHSLPDERPGPIEALDAQLARGFLRIEQWESTSNHFLNGNPTLFTGEAVFGVLGVLLGHGPLDERLNNATARLAAVPRLLEQGQALVWRAPPAWIDRARRECSGARALLDRGMAGFLADNGTARARLLEAAEAASQAFARFDAFLVSLPRMEEYAAGAEVLDLLLDAGHALDMSADALERLGLERMAEAEQTLAGLPADEAHDGPSREQYLARFGVLWTEAGTVARAHDLLTVPDWPVHYVEQPGWVRESAPSFYFLPYRSPAPLDPPSDVEYFVPPYAPDVSDSVIKLNHVLHHGSWGHHAQNWHALQAQSRIGRIAAVDCAARIAMLCGGTLAEGWACYATDLADEAGFLTAAERRAQCHSRLRMAARAVVDIRLHQGRFSLTEAARFYRERVGMSDSAASAEATKNSLFPATACMYLAGWDAIWRVRRELRAHEGPHFSLRAFHDRLLSFGSVPVSLVAEQLRQPVLAHQ
jgi:Bacterial protein of unknown function (DUF885)